MSRRGTEDPTGILVLPRTLNGRTTSSLWVSPKERVADQYYEW